MKKYKYVGFIPFALVLALGCSNKPKIKLEHQGNKIIAHVETLGEYPTTVKYIRLSEQTGSVEVLNLTAEESPSQIYQMTFKSGINNISDSIPDIKLYRINTPSNKNEFTLDKDKEYLLEVWGEAASPSKAKIHF